MLRITRSKVLVAAVATLLATGLVGTVFAAWLADGSGAGYSAAGQSQDLSTLNVSAQVGTVDNKLYPGADGDVLIKIHNPNPFPVRITGIADSGAITAGGGIGTCTTTGVSFTDQTGLSINVPAGGDSANVVLTNVAHMDNTSDNGCQSATFTIPVDLTGASNAS